MLAQLSLVIFRPAQPNAFRTFWVDTTLLTELSGWILVCNTFNNRIPHLLFWHKFARRATQVDSLGKQTI